MTRGRWLGVLVVAAATVRLAAAEDPKAMVDAKAYDKLVVDTLRDVHNRGADLYNTGKDYAGAYRLYEGALRTVRPLLAHRPEAQKIIDEGLAAAEKEPDIARKAFMLHETIEKVRAELRGATAPAKKPEDKKPEDKKPEVKKPEDKKPEDKKPEDKKPDDKKPEDKKVTPPPMPEDKKPDDKKTPPPPKPEDKKPDDPKPTPPKVEDKKPPTPPVKVTPEDKKPDPAPVPKLTVPAAGGVTGKVTYQGKPLADGEVTLVSLDKDKPKVVTTKIKDGAYTFADAPPGKYAVTVSATKDGKSIVPEKYTTAGTSGITVEVKPGATTFDIDLK